MEGDKTPREKLADLKQFYGDSFAGLGRSLSSVMGVGDRRAAERVAEIIRGQREPTSRERQAINRRDAYWRTEAPARRIEKMEGVEDKVRVSLDLLEGGATERGAAVPISDLVPQGVDIFAYQIQDELDSVDFANVRGAIEQGVPIELALRNAETGSETHVIIRADSMDDWLGNYYDEFRAWIEVEGDSSGALVLAT